MRTARLTAVVLALLCLVCTLGTPVFAMTSGFTTEPLTAQEEADFRTAVTVTRTEQPPVPYRICCFDVRPDGQVAVGTENHNEKWILVYSSEGAFLYALSFELQGSFQVEWAGAALNIYFVRAGYLGEVSPQGTVTELRCVSSTPENNSWANRLGAASRTVGETEYALQTEFSDGFRFGGYTRLVKTTADDSTVMLYEAEKQELTLDDRSKKTLLTSAICGGVILFGTYPTIFLVRKRKKQ